MYRHVLPLVLLIPVGPLACGEIEDEGIVNDENPILSANGISSNAISSNAISSNAISSNAISSNAISSNAISSNALVMQSLRDKSSTGDLARTFFRYLVNCALPEGRSVTYTWTDSAGIKRTEINPGALGLARNWENGAATQGDKEIVSACLGARTNSMGIAVPLSMRAAGNADLALAPNERSTFTYGEGAFWGNLFNGGSPYLYACSKVAFGRGANTSAYLTQGRTCTTAGCGIITALGRCYASDSASTGQACWDRPGSTNDWVNKCGPALSKGASSNQNTNVITVWLKP